MTTAESLARPNGNLGSHKLAKMGAKSGPILYIYVKFKVITLTIVYNCLPYQLKLNLCTTLVISCSEDPQTIKLPTQRNVQRFLTR